MIIPEDTPPTPKTSIREPEQTIEPAQAPPAYSGEGSYQAGEGSYQAGTGSTQPLYGLPPILHGEPAGRRFFKAFVVAILVWTLFVALMGSAAEAGQQAGNIERENKDGQSAWPMAKDGNILACVRGPRGWNWMEDHPMSLSFELPRTSDVLYLFSRGLQSTGSVVIIQDERIHEPDTVHVDILAQKHTPTYLGAVAVCLLEREPGEQGIGIFTPKHWTSRRRLPELEFEIVVRLPKVPISHPLHIAAFETALPNFAHRIGDISNAVHFGSLALSGTNAAVSSHSVHANKTVISTTNSYIRGHFESHDSLVLATTNAVIEADVVSYNDGAGNLSQINLITENARINSSVSLRSNSGTGGSFAVNGKSTNGRLSLDVLSLPVDAKLLLSAQTSNAASSVTVPPTFEGSFSVKTSNSRASIIQKRRIDPSGRHRKVGYAEHGTISSRAGWVTWLEEHIGAIPATVAEGILVVKTSNSPATLTI